MPCPAAPLIGRKFINRKTGIRHSKWQIFHLISGTITDMDLYGTGVLCSFASMEIFQELFQIIKHVSPEHIFQSRGSVNEDETQDR
jgi:hypothetical protein